MKKTLCLLATTLMLFSCKEDKLKEVAIRDTGLLSVTREQFNTTNMQVGRPQEQDFDVTVKATGKIDVPPQNRAKVTTFVPGYIKSTKLLVGNKVTKGQALLTLENTEFLDIQKDYLEVVEQINYLKSEYDRQKTLYDEKITSQKNYLKAESEYRRAKAMYQSLKAKLKLLNINPEAVEKGNLSSMITIYAPISGDIVVMNANLGMYAGTADVLLEIIETDHLHIELNVFEKDILKVKEGEQITFKVPEASNEVFNAEVHLVGKSIEGNDRTINVHGHLEENLKQRLLTGMFVEANIIVDSKKGLSIPIDAAIKENNKYYVLLLDSKNASGYSFKKVPITIGQVNDKFIELLPNNQINAKSSILIKGAYDLKD
jgi:cobalt-zinc-cadmium efflux system membrane fusion protein